MPLSPESIVDAAIALIEREGCAALTMRRLGSELDVEAMSLYHHFANRERLLRGIADRLLEPLGELALDGGWRDPCLRFGRALREIAAARPAAFRLVGLQPFDTPASLRAVERLLGALVGHGLAPADALAIYRAVASYTRGYALAEATGFTIDAAAPERRAQLAALPADRFPILAGRTDELAALDPAVGFERGLRALLDGLA